MNWSHVFFSFKGRIPRYAYWLGLLALVGVFILAFIALINFYQYLSPEKDSISFVLSAPAVIFIIIYIAMTYCNISILVKRFHDRNKSGWWILFFVAVGASPVIVWLFGFGGSLSEPNALIQVLNLVSTLVWLWFFIELGFFKGTRGPNRFGPDPLGAVQSDASL